MSWRLLFILFDKYVSVSIYEHKTRKLYIF